MTYAWVLKRDLTSVVLPLCRGPVNVKTGNRDAELNRLDCKFLSTITVIPDCDSEHVRLDTNYFDLRSSPS